MFVHKDIIIVFIFILLVCLLFIFLFLKDLRSVIKNLQSFSGKPIKSSRLFFFKLYEPIIFNLNSILKKYQDNYRIEQLRVFFFNYFFQNFPDPLLIIDQRLHVIEFNSASEELLGNVIKNKNIFSVLRIPELGELIDESQKKRKPIEAEVNLIYPSERIYKIWISGSRDVGKNKLSFIRLFDTTAEHNLQNLQKDFIANASHELKTPISVIIGYCETLLSEKNTKKNIKESFLKTMGNEAERMSRLVNDLLSLSRIERTEFSPPDEKVNLIDILKDVQKICKERKLFKKLKCKFFIPRKGIFVIGDESELKQVFFNIIENAITHSHSKKAIEVNIKQTKDLVTLIVEDFGIGVANQNIPLLTKRFYRVNPSRSRDSGNTGLGLSIVKHILNRHNANFQIESEMGKGSKFIVTFDKGRSAL
jgi:two-component system phosphate regulon sensor histidine kinase PhoR